MQGLAKNMSHKTTAYRIVQLNKGRYLYPWSGPIPVVKVHGKPIEMGLQHGKQMKELIQKTVKDTWDVLPGIIGVTKDEIAREITQ